MHKKVGKRAGDNFSKTVTKFRSDGFPKYAHGGEILHRAIKEKETV